MCGITKGWGYSEVWAHTHSLGNIEAFLIYILKLLKIGLGHAPPENNYGFAQKSLYHNHSRVHQNPRLNPGFQLLLENIPVFIRLRRETYRAGEISYKSAKKNAFLLAYYIVRVIMNKNK